MGEDPDPDGSSMSYLIGDFDGTRFTAESSELTRLDHGRDFYAGVTFHNAPGCVVIMIGWMSNWSYADVIPTAPWRGAMSLPRQLSLRTVGGVARLVQQPPEFIRVQLRADEAARQFEMAQAAEVTISGHSLMELLWDPATTGTRCITRQGAAVEAVHANFPSTSTVAVDATAPVRLLLSLDGPLLELFINDGEATATNLVVLGAGAVAAHRFGPPRRKAPKSCSKFFCVLQPPNLPGGRG